MCAATAHLSAATALAAYDNFPMRSINMAAADTVNFYVLHSNLSVHQPRATHGTLTSDGGFVLVGRGTESASSSVLEAFAVKLDASGQPVWSWRSGAAGDDAVSQVVQIPGAIGDLLLAGFRTVSGVYRRSVTKLAHATGVEVWTATSFGDGAGAHGAWQAIGNRHTTAAPQSVPTSLPPDASVPIGDPHGSCALLTCHVCRQ